MNFDKNWAKKNIFKYKDINLDMSSFLSSYEKIFKVSKLNRFFLMITSGLVPFKDYRSFELLCNFKKHQYL